MNKSAAIIALTATVFTCCLFASVSAGTLKAAAAEVIKDAKDADAKVEGRGWGGVGSSPLHGNEVFGGPTVIAMALPIAIALIVALWVAAYNTLRSQPPKIGYNAGIVEQAGWGGAQANVGGGYGYDTAASNLAATQLVTAAATQGAVAAGRSFDELTHRVTRSIAKKQRKH